MLFAETFDAFILFQRSCCTYVADLGKFVYARNSNQFTNVNAIRKAMSSMLRQTIGSM